MGRIITPKYRVEVKVVPGRVSALSWRGKVSAARLKEWFDAYNRSYEPGGVNAHLGIRFVAAKIVRQSDGVVMCEHAAPMFEVV